MEEGDQVAAASVIPTVIPDEGEAGSNGNGQSDLPLQ
jgi:hypothetical protein